MNAPPAPTNGSGSDPSSATNRSLLQHVQAGNPDAWDRLVTLYAPLVLGWCRHGELQTADTADIVQEVFLAVATHVSGFRKQSAGDTFRGWLRTITRNKIHDHYRRLGREPGGEGGTEAGVRLSQVPEHIPAGQPEDPSEIEASAERSLFRRALASIRGEFEPRTWQAFWSTTIEGRAPKDVANELAMTSGAVRVAKSRVLQRLRDELGDFTGL
jgi:RNA polymerase sigma-70 factor (ECF subfamily)